MTQGSSKLKIGKNDVLIELNKVISARKASAFRRPDGSLNKKALTQHFTEQGYQVGRIIDAN